MTAVAERPVLREAGTETDVPLFQFAQPPRMIRGATIETQVLLRNLPAL